MRKRYALVCIEGLYTHLIDIWLQMALFSKVVRTGCMRFNRRTVRLAVSSPCNRVRKVSGVRHN